MLTREDARTYAGLLAASSVAASKQIHLREPPPSGLPARFRPSSLGDLPRLFSGHVEESTARRVARLSAAALVYSVDKKDPVQPKKILHGDEEQVLSDLNEARRDHFGDDRSCPHCRLLSGTLYRRRWGTLPPVVVVNHSARVNIAFDPETCISEANISNFQVIVPEAVAHKMMRLSHPLHWATPAGSLFQRADAVNADGTRLRGDRATIERTWDERASSDGAFIYEDVVWPVNEQLSANSENIIKFRELRRTASSLSYKYCLQRSVRSNFGVAWEPAGLDLDGGFYEARAIPLAEISADDISSGSIRLNLKPRDVDEMRATYDPTVSRALYTNWSGAGPDREQATPEEIVDVLTTLRLLLEKKCSQLGPFYVVDVSASKELHFTIPENGPIELWDLLTWTAPAILFTFLNRAICHAPHLLLDELMKSPLEEGVFYVAGG